jgi:uncharacterized OB-fold protein
MANVPLPAVRGEEAYFYSELAAGRIAYQLCGACGRAVWYPRVVCPDCGADRLAWHVSAGIGTVYSYTVLERAGHPVRREDVPYAVALVDLDEGIRILGNLALADDDGATPIGRRVTAAITRQDADAEGGVATILFTPKDEAA